MPPGDTFQISTHDVIPRFRPPEAPQATKAAIRTMLPHGLKESISKVNSLKYPLQ